jgi:hypothetical protein
MSMPGDPRWDDRRWPYDQPSPFVLSDCGHWVARGSTEPVGGKEICSECFRKRYALVYELIAPETDALGNGEEFGFDRQLVDTVFTDLDESDIEQARRQR